MTEDSAMLESHRQLPDLWAEKATCPICNAPRMFILRSPDRNDQMTCKRCGLCFEIEQGGSRLMVTAVPKGLSTKLIGHWFTMPDLQNIGERLAARKAAIKRSPTAQKSKRSSTTFQATQIAVDKPAIEEPLPEPLPEPLAKEARRAVELYTLGNSIEQIRASLENSAALTPDELNRVIEEVEKLELKKSAAQRKRLTIIMVVIGIFILCIALCVIGFQIFNKAGGLDKLEAQAIATQPVTDNLQANRLPIPLQTALPAGVKVVNPPTPQVELILPASASSTRCPRNPLEAAQAFGGSSETWQSADMGRGWMYIAKSPATITVPQRMTAGYIVFDIKNMEMKSVTGPAVVKNVYMITISCE